MTPEEDNLSDAAWSAKVASLAVDALIDSGIVDKIDFARATEIAAEEIRIRLIIGDRPPIKP